MLFGLCFFVFETTNSSNADQLVALNNNDLPIPFVSSAKAYDAPAADPNRSSGHEVLISRCSGCHDQSRADVHANGYAFMQNGKVAERFAAQFAGNSRLTDLFVHRDPNKRMPPPPAASLSAGEISLVNEYLNSFPISTGRLTAPASLTGAAPGRLGEPLSPDSVPPSCGPISCDPRKPNQGELTANRVMAIAAHCQVDSPDTLLPLLPTVFRKWKGSFGEVSTMLAHSSRSAQGASPSRPRVMIRNADARLTLAFTDENLPGGKSLEMIQYRDDGPGPRLQFASIDFHSGRPVRADAHQCYACHQGLHRWGNYPMWKGMIGSASHDASDPTAGRAIKHETAMLDWLTREQRAGRLPARYQSVQFPTSAEGHVDTKRFGSDIMGWNARIKLKALKDRPDFDQFKYLAAMELMCNKSEVVYGEHESLVRDVGAPFTEARRRIRGPSASWSLMPPGLKPHNPQYSHTAPFTDDIRSLDKETAGLILMELAKTDAALAKFVRSHSGKQVIEHSGSRFAAANSSNIVYKLAIKACPLLEARAKDEIKRSGLPSPWTDTTRSLHSKSAIDADYLSGCSPREVSPRPAPQPNQGIR